MSEKYRVPPRDAVAEKLEAYIIQNKLPPETRLPSERELCALLGTNRTTLHAAVEWLELEGIVRIAAGVGVFVASPPFQRNLQDLESFDQVVRRAGHTLQTMVLSFRTITASTQIAEKLQLTEGDAVYELIRLRLLDGEPVHIETTVLAQHRFPNLMRYDFSKHSLYQVLQSDYGAQIIKGREKIGITRATETEAQHLQVQPDCALFFLSGITEDAQGMPNEYFKSVLLPDKVSFSSMLLQEREQVEFGEEI